MPSHSGDGSLESFDGQIQYVNKCLFYTHILGHSQECKKLHICLGNTRGAQLYRTGENDDRNTSSAPGPQF